MLMVVDVSIFEIALLTLCYISDENKTVAKLVTLSEIFGLTMHVLDYNFTWCS